MQTAIKGEITNKGKTMRITIPVELRQPAGLDATLTSIDADVQGQVGQERDRLQHEVQEQEPQGHGQLEFATRSNNTPGPAPSSLTEKVKCTK